MEVFVCARGCREEAKKSAKVLEVLEMKQ